MAKQAPQESRNRQVRPEVLKTAAGAAVMLLIMVTGARSQDEATSMKPAYNVLYTFNGGTNGSNPNLFGTDQGLIQDKDGNLYGTTPDGGYVTTAPFSACPAGCGVVYKLDKAGKETVLYTFQGSPDGAGPVGSLVRDEEGNLYGTTPYGGSNSFLSAGTVFKVDPEGKETVLHSFSGTDGSHPSAGLVRDEEGNLYGTAPDGGISQTTCFGFGCGVVFKIDPSGTETTLYSFTGGADGGKPIAGLIRDENGNLYGTTNEGGSSLGGVVFKLDRYGKETVLYNFIGGSSGGGPFSGLVRDEQGNLYGTANSGGDLTGVCQSFGCGVVYKLDPFGKETVLYAFKGGSDGVSPFGRLIREGDRLYGTTEFGGVSGSVCFGFGCGTVFEVSPAGKETVLYKFTGGADGAMPFVGLVSDEQGDLYGTTGYGGDLTSSQSSCYAMGQGCGVVFKLKPGECKDADDASETSAPDGD
jgi:uncharacterized repeat protein (TIGR03803 family)